MAMGVNDVFCSKSCAEFASKLYEHKCESRRNELMSKMIRGEEVVIIIGRPNDYYNDLMSAAAHLIMEE